MNELTEYLRKKFADVSLSISERSHCNAEPFMSDREPNEPLVLNLNKGEDNES